MKFIYALFILPFIISCHNNTKIPAEFDLKAFEKNKETAKYLLEYHTIDSLANAEYQRQGFKNGFHDESFLFQDSNKAWHAVFGTIKDTLTITYHLVIDSNLSIIASKIKYPSDFSGPFIRARLVSEKFLDNTPLHEFFVKRQSNKTFYVWALPKTDKYGVIRERGYLLKLDETGSTSDIVNTYNAIHCEHGINPVEDEVKLEFGDEEPSLLAIKLALYYSEYYNKVSIITKNLTSTLQRTKSGDRQWTFVGASNEICP